jgi:hypothetical protein
MTPETDDLGEALEHNLKIRRELGTELAKADGIRSAKQDQGTAYRLGWVLYFTCLVLGVAWLCFFLAVASDGPNGVLGEIANQPLKLVVVGGVPVTVLYGIGRALRYVLSEE